jgi:zinc/manganese transport system substrate-binding protein
MLSCPAMRLALWLLPVAALAAGAGCSDDSASGDTRLTAVATTTHAADLVRNVGGERVEVRAMLRPGADPHDYEPRPSDVRAIAESGLVVRSGGEVDEWLDEVLDNAGEDAEPLTLIESVETIEGEDGADPHWWQDPRNAVRAVAAIRDALVDADPGGRAAYRRNAGRYVDRFERMDREVAACVARVPSAKRKIVTTHDSLGYFARRYGIEVVGAVIPSLSTQGQASARDVDRLVEQIRDEGVEAVFPETAVDARLERAIAREAGARVGGALYADSLGPRGSPGETYLGALAADTAALVEGMSGGALRCRPRG